jgi:TRAP-type mannitol/chloroaromatic compound transport system permease small subunit
MNKIVNALASTGHAIDKTSDWIHKGMSLLVIPLLLITLYGVIMRYVFHMPPSWGWQVLLLIFTPMVVLPGGRLLTINGHIKLDLLYSRWSTRGKAIADVATYFALLLFVVMLFWVISDLTWDSVARGEVMYNNAFKGPVYPKKIAITLGFFFLFFSGIVQFARNIRTIKTGTKPGDQE